MIKAVIVDDEQHCINRITTLLKDYENEVQLVATASTVKEGLNIIKKVQPDLLSLDVEIADKTGFDLLREIESPSFDVIFTTAHDKYAVMAFKFCAIDYLLKPVDESDFAIAMKKILDSDDRQDMTRQLSELIKGAGLNKPRKIGVPTLNGIVFVLISDIRLCRADGNYTEIFLNNNHKIVVSKTLKEFDDLLSDYQFFRVHNSNLVNLDYVKSYNKGKGGFLILDDDTNVEVSSRRKDELLKKLSLI